MPYPRKPTPERACAVCGKALERKRFSGRLEDPTAFMKRRFCDQACMGIAARKPDATQQAVRRRQWSNRLSKCEECGATDVKLELHHLDECPANDAPSNLRTLCTSCHQTWHWNHGQRRARRRVPAP